MEDSGPSVTWDFDAGTMRHQQKARSEEENGEEEEEGEEGGKDRKRLTLVETEDIEFSPQMSVDETLLAVNHRVSIVEGEGEEEGDRSNSMKRSSVIRVDEEEEENAVVSLRDALMITDGSSLSLSLQDAVSPRLEEEAAVASPEPQSMSLSRILLPLLQQVGYDGSRHVTMD